MSGDRDMSCACGAADEVPARIGRPVRSMPDGFARGSAGHAPKCCACPKWLRETVVCSLRGSHQAGGSPACKYGIVLIRARRMADRRAASGSAVSEKEVEHGGQQ